MICQGSSMVPRLAQLLSPVDVTIPGTVVRAAESELVTGGTGGLGALTARWLAQRGAHGLVLASRGGFLARDAVEEWAQLLQSGADVWVMRCDAAEAAGAVRLLARTRGELPQCSGVWHAAGALSDGLLPNQDASSMWRVHAPKASGAAALQGAGERSSLRAQALFSSVAALFGGAGQANYSAANAVLDALAVCRRVRGCVAVSVQWGAWAQVGMAARGAAAARVAAMEAASSFGRIDA